MEQEVHQLRTLLSKVVEMIESDSTKIEKPLALDLADHLSDSARRVRACYCDKVDGTDFDTQIIDSQKVETQSLPWSDVTGKKLDSEQDDILTPPPSKKQCIEVFDTEYQAEHNVEQQEESPTLSLSGSDGVSEHDVEQLLDHPKVMQHIEAKADERFEQKCHEEKEKRLAKNEKQRERRKEKGITKCGLGYDGNEDEKQFTDEFKAHLKQQYPREKRWRIQDYFHRAVMEAMKNSNSKSNVSASVNSDVSHPTEDASDAHSLDDIENSTQSSEITAIQVRKSLPKLKDLLKELQRKVCDKWEDLGIQLEVEETKLSTIKQENNNSSESCFREMVRAWLKKIDPVPTWSAMIEALEIVGYMDVANELKPKYLMLSSQSSQSLN